MTFVVHIPGYQLCFQMQVAGSRFANWVYFDFAFAGYLRNVGRRGGRKIKICGSRLGVSTGHEKKMLQY